MLDLVRNIYVLRKLTFQFTDSNIPTQKYLYVAYIEFSHTFHGGNSRKDDKYFSEIQSAFL